MEVSSVLLDGILFVAGNFNTNHKQQRLIMQKFNMHLKNIFS